MKEVYKISQGLLAWAGSWCRLSSTTPKYHAVHWSCVHAGYNLYQSGRKLCFVLVTDLRSAIGQGISFFFLKLKIVVVILGLCKLSQISLICKN